MSGGKQYIVTRGGREVLRGDDSELLNAARAGQLLSNDLVYDAAEAQWSFARSLGILRGFPLRTRARSSNEDDTEGSVLKTGRLILGQRRRVGFILRVLGILTLLAGFTLILFLIPEKNRKKERKEDLSKVLDLEDRAMKIEGSGQGISEADNKREGSSNMDSKRVTVDGEYDEDIEIDDEGRKAALLLTPEELAELNVPSSPANSSEAVSEQQQAVDGNSEQIDSSPSIEAAKLPPVVKTVDQNIEQPLVLIKPRLESLNERLAKSLDQATPKTLPDQIEEGVEELAELGEDLGKAKTARTEETEFERLIESVRDKLKNACSRMERPKNCILRIEHPDWTGAAIDAIVRSDVILGMNAEQVVVSQGEPLERREEGDQAVWCYDETCEERVEFSGNRVLRFKAGVVKSDTSIERIPSIDEGR